MIVAAEAVIGTLLTLQVDDIFFNLDWGNFTKRKLSLQVITIFLWKRKMF
jgi:hypothetical protein